MELEKIPEENQIISSGECETIFKGDCKNSNWAKVGYNISVLGCEKKEYYECVTDCGFISHMIITNKPKKAG